MDLREKLGLLIIENEKPSAGVMRIAIDQARRTEVRQEAQRRLAKPKKVKVPREPKPKKERKPRTPRPKASKKTRTKANKDSAEQAAQAVGEVA